MKGSAVLLLIAGLSIGSVQASAAGSFEVHNILQLFVLPAEIPIPGSPCEGGELAQGSALVDDDFTNPIPPRFTRIQKAVDWAGSGFTIFICAGEYHEHVEIEKDDLHLIGDGAEFAIVDGIAPKKGDVFEIEDAERIEIEGLTIANGSNGIEVEKSSGHRFHHIVFRNNDDGIDLEKASGVTIFENEFIGNKDGVVIENKGSSGHSIMNNRFSANRRAIVLEESYGNLIEMNAISTGNLNETHGILLESSDDNTIVGNHISEKTWGIELRDGSRGNDVSGNQLIDNEIAILLKVKHGRQNMITLNTIQSNEIGILQKKNDGKVGEATIYHNAFLGNGYHVAGYQLGSNHWDIGYDCAIPDGGNFWDDHTSPDDWSGPDQGQTGSDQIVDNPRSLGPGAEDRYPFVTQDAWFGFVGVNCGDPIITLAADPTAVPADGLSTLVIAANVVDESGIPVPDGTPITFTTDRGEFLGGEQQMESIVIGGEAAITLISGTEPGMATVTAVVGVDTGHTEVEFVALESTPTSTLPVEPNGGLNPILECVVDSDDGSFIAHFGYQNDYEEPVEIAVGEGNRFDPEPADRGQPLVFQPGRSPLYPDSGFSVEFDGSELVWTLGDRMATASDSPDQRCAEQEPGPEATATPLPQFEANINFQPGSAPVPDGYLVDSGEPLGDRGNGYSYGWSAGNDFTRDRDSSDSPDQRYDTINHMQKPENPDASWEIAVPSGSYLVSIVAGDASYTDSVYSIMVEGTLAIDGTPTEDTHWFLGTITVDVDDGFLTVSNGVGAENNKISFIEIRLVN